MISLYNKSLNSIGTTPIHKKQTKNKIINKKKFFRYLYQHHHLTSFDLLLEIVALIDTTTF